MQAAQSDRPIFSIVAVLGLLATGIVAQPTPLRTARPISGGEPTIVAWGDERVPARLWQDPLMTSFKAAKQELDAAIQHCQSVGRSDEQRESQAVIAFNRLQRSKDFMREGSETTVLPVLVPPVGYSSDQEMRLRIRTAIGSALIEDGYVPVQSKRLGYIWHPLPGTRVWPKQDERESPSSTQHFERLVKVSETHQVIPFEWFKEAGKGQEGRRKVLVLWLDEEKLENLVGDTLQVVQSFFQTKLTLVETGEALIDVYESVVEQVAQVQQPKGKRKPLAVPAVVAGPGEKASKALIGFPDVRIIGPTSSTGLLRIIREGKEALWRGTSLSKGSPSVTVYSPFATIRDEKLVEATHSEFPIDYGVDLERTLATDDVLMEATLGELEGRGFDKHAANKFFLIAEWDTHYGRDIGKAFDWALKERGFTQSKVVRHSYLRGLDGVASGELPRSSTEGKNTDEPDGPSQLDFLRRLVAQIIDEAHDSGGGGFLESEVNAAESLPPSQAGALKLAAVSSSEPGRIAIGIVGSDEYDKLLVLQALRPAFPDVIFFTTDLDARYSHPSQIKWTRNLIVASSFGLYQKEQQRWTAPFRNSYMSSVFTACRRALYREQTLEDRPSGVVPALNSAADLSMYEIGSHGATRLPPTEQARDLYAAGEPASLLWGAGQERVRRGVLGGSRVVLLLALVLGGIGIVALIRGERRPFKAIPMLETWLDQPLDLQSALGAKEKDVHWVLRHSRALQVLNLGLCCLLLGIVGRIAAVSDEPIALFQGISIWPTEAIRVVAIFLCVQYLLVSMRRIHVAQARATAEFGLPRGGGAEGWKTYERRSTTRSRLTRTMLWTSGYGCLAVLLDLAFGMPEAPARGELAILTDRILNLACWSCAAFLLFFVFDATWVRTQMVRMFLGSSLRFPGEQKGFTDSYRECREVRYVGMVSEAETRILIYPFVILLMVAASRYEVFDSWYWNVPLAAAIGVAFLVVIWSGLNLRNSAERLRRNSLRVIQQEIHEKERTPGDDSLVSRLKGYRDEVMGMRNGAFASLAGNPVIQGLLIPLGGLGGVTMLESFVR